MNKNIDLTKILKDCPKGWEFYSSVLGDVELVEIRNEGKQNYQVIVQPVNKNFTDVYTKEGFYLKGKGECTFFPSKYQRDWSKFTAPWYKKDKFNPNTLKPFDKVLIRRGSENYNVWFPDFVSEPPNGTNNNTLCMCVGEDIAMVIPYNDDTKHLAGTDEEAPEYYKYWEE